MSTARLSEVRREFEQLAAELARYRSSLSAEARQHGSRLSHVEPSRASVPSPADRPCPGPVAVPPDRRVRQRGHLGLRSRRDDGLRQRTDGQHAGLHRRGDGVDLAARGPGRRGTRSGGRVPGSAAGGGGHDRVGGVPAAEARRGAGVDRHQSQPVAGPERHVPGTDRVRQRHHRTASPQRRAAADARSSSRRPSGSPTWAAGSGTSERTSSSGPTSCTASSSWPRAGSMARSRAISRWCTPMTGR